MTDEISQLLSIVNRALGFDHKRNTCGTEEAVDDGHTMNLTTADVPSLSPEGVMMALHFDRLLAGWIHSGPHTQQDKPAADKKKGGDGKKNKPLHSGVEVVFLGRTHSESRGLPSILKETPSMISDLSEILKSVCNTYPRLHGLWVEYFDTMFDDPSKDVVVSTQLLEAAWSENVEKNLLNSTHERKAMVFKLVEHLGTKLCSVCTTQNDQKHPFLIVLSPLFLRTLLNSVSSRTNYLYAQAKSTLDIVMGSVKADMRENDQLAVVMQLLTHGSNRFDKITATSSVPPPPLV
jgi:hypothetical protein